MFSTSVLTPIVQQEINVAFEHLKDKSKILIIYNKVKNLKHGSNCTEVYIDAGKYTPQQILDKVISQLKINEHKPIKKATLKQDDTASVLGGILLIGLGLLALDSLISTAKK